MAQVVQHRAEILRVAVDQERALLILAKVIKAGQVICEITIQGVTKLSGHVFFRRIRSYLSVSDGRRGKTLIIGTCDTGPHSPGGMTLGGNPCPQYVTDH